MEESAAPPEGFEELGDAMTKGAIAQRGEFMQTLDAEYEAHLDVEMEHLHNQFVSFISSAHIPLPHVMVVLEMLRLETLEQIAKKYLGG
jgi:hypothetical protein